MLSIGHISILLIMTCNQLKLPEEDRAHFVREYPKALEKKNRIYNRLIVTEKSVFFSDRIVDSIVKWVKYDNYCMVDYLVGNKTSRKILTDKHILLLAKDSQAGKWRLGERNAIANMDTSSRKYTNMLPTSYRMPYDGLYTNVKDSDLLTLEKELTEKTDKTDTLKVALESITTEETKDNLPGCYLLKYKVQQDNGAEHFQYTGSFVLDPKSNWVIRRGSYHDDYTMYV